jgi:hypothetical protein
MKRGGRWSPREGRPVGNSKLSLELKRRVKTRCSLPSEKSAIHLLYGLSLSAKIRFRNINGWWTIAEVIAGSKIP